MNRRGFLKLLGAAATLAAIPDIAGARKIAEQVLTIEGKPFLIFECAELKEGFYTFTAHVKVPGGQWKGLLVTGIRAYGGETAMRVQIEEGDSLSGPCLSVEPLAVVTSRRMSDVEIIDFTKGDRAVVTGGVEISKRTNRLKYAALDE